MEQIRIEIFGASAMKMDQAELQRRREANDEAAKRSFITGMQKKEVSPTPCLPIPAPPVGGAAPVTLKELAERLKMDRSACRRYVLSLGYTPIRQRTAESGFQTALTFTPKQANEIFGRRRSEGYC